MGWKWLWTNGPHWRRGKAAEGGSGVMGLSEGELSRVDLARGERASLEVRQAG